MRVSIGFVVLVACGSNPPSKLDAPAVSDGKKFDAPIDTPSTPQLTVKNYLTWCSVTIGNGAPSAAGMQQVPITASGTIMLQASPSSSSFEDAGNMWHHTTGDTGTGETGTVVGTGMAAVSTAMVTVTMGASKCVWVCCPFSATSGQPEGSGCNVAEQCL
jgi:hypothetical protein